MRKLYILFILPFFLLLARPARAYGLEYKSFDSKITINQDTTITVVETISVDFTSSHHGMLRDIPERKLNVVSVKDENGKSYKYKVSGGGIKEIKIGDPDQTITGVHTYVITYTVRDAIKEFSDHYELYWNITGSAWDSQLPRPTAEIISPFARITKIACFAGSVGSAAENCEGAFSDNSAKFVSLESTGVGSDFTVVVGLDKNNSLVFPSGSQKLLRDILDNWFYAVTPLPFLIPLFYWLKKGRDQRYVSDNIYYDPKDKSTRTVGMFERKFLPMVYSPIKGLTPAEVGTLLDQKVDMADVVGEILELARLGYMKIKKIDKKWIFGKADYEFKELKPKADKGTLPYYQRLILDGIFKSGSPVRMSELKLKFYKNLKSIREDLYEDMDKQGFFDGNPDTIRNNWTAGVIVLGVFTFFVISVTGAIDTSPLSIFVLLLFTLLGVLVTRSMPRRTPHGYALYRQINGLKYFIGKGVWRQEIAEKKLFIDEILPLAVCLGVVDKLAHDMKDLGMEPPKYVTGTSMNSFASDISGFQSTAGRSLSSAPGGSGGSGFSGGSSGGGGGGGGGGGW